MCPGFGRLEAKSGIALTPLKRPNLRSRLRFATRHPGVPSAGTGIFLWLEVGHRKAVIMQTQGSGFRLGRWRPGVRESMAGLRFRSDGEPRIDHLRIPQPTTRPWSPAVSEVATPSHQHGSQSSGVHHGADPFEPVRISTRSGRCTTLALPAVLAMVLAATASAETCFVEMFADDPIAAGRFVLADPETGEPQFVYQPETHSLLVRHHTGRPTIRLVHPLARPLTDRDSFTLRVTFRVIDPQFSSEEDYFAQLSFGLMNAAGTGPNRTDHMPDAQDPSLHGAFDLFAVDYTLSNSFWGYYPGLAPTVTASLPDPYFPGGYYDAMSLYPGAESLLTEEALLPYTTLTAVVEYDGATRLAILRIYEGSTALPINLEGEGGPGGTDGDVTTIVTAVKTSSALRESYPFRVDRIGLFSWKDDWAAMDGTAKGLDAVYERIELTWTAYPDLTDDGRVDADDVEAFQTCQSGPAVPQEDPVCQNADLDADGDVDQDDFGLLQRQLGTERPS